MSRKIIFSSLFLLLLNLPSIASDTIQPKLWAGKLSFGSAELTLVLNIYENPGGGRTATIDSPDQGARGIPVDTLAVTSDSLSFRIKSLKAEYKARFNANQDTLSGTFYQAGLKLPLVLARTSEVKEPDRPQEPKPPLPYITREITFDNPRADIALVGTLSVPPSPGKHPAVVLVSGSGPQNRDEEIFGHKPFLVLSDYLTRKGYVVLRYDDRGIGKSSGVFNTATTLDFASDAAAALAYLRTLPEVDSSKAGVIGHSEGALIAEILAAGPSAPDFIVSMAGPSLPGEDILLSQMTAISRASGMSEEIINATLDLNKDVFNVVRKNKDDEKAKKKIILLLGDFNQKMKDTPGFEPVGADQMEMQAKNITSPWFRTFLFLDPMDYLRKIKCPVLALDGSLDLQVLPVENLDGWEKGMLMAGNPDYTLEQVSGVNHLFQTATTGLPSEYSQITETISPVVLDMIGDWITRQVK